MRTRVPIRIHTGQCLCGHVKFEASGAPLWIAHCHCLSCRRQTGSCVATFVGFRRTQLVFPTGQRAVYKSSPGVRRGFCAKCGTPLSYEADRHAGEIHIYVCSLDRPQDFVPQVHVFHAEHVPWLELNDGLPRHAALSGGADPESWGPMHR